METPEFELAFEPRHGRPVRVAAGVLRVTAPNAGPFTFHGTNSYVVGGKDVAVIDPGPDDARHFAALVAAIEGRRVRLILVTHTHRDHSRLARRLGALTGAPVLAEGPHRSARPLHAGETNPLSEGADTDFVPDRTIADGQRLVFGDDALTAVATPGHAANHLAFALDGAARILFSGDHVMAWSTTIVAPPDGSMTDYLASLDRLIARDDRLLLPGHGGPVTRPQTFLRALRAHRRLRERAILERVIAGDGKIGAIVRALYATTDPRLHPAAALSVFSHLERLVESGAVATDGPPALDGHYRPG
ncbi:MBL fold metallo-hydrolase [Ensifer soli]|uniref:MBL fold metallo-hydrolase n=1 Tax=Ciceribacter sp. sgz301302 TaxID=3342379 RepID=UPI0035BB5D28